MANSFKRYIDSRSWQTPTALTLERLQNSNHHQTHTNTSIYSDEDEEIPCTPQSPKTPSWSNFTNTSHLLVESSSSSSSSSYTESGGVKRKFIDMVRQLILKNHPKEYPCEQDLINYLINHKEISSDTTDRYLLHCLYDHEEEENVSFVGSLTHVFVYMGYDAIVLTLISLGADLNQSISKCSLNRHEGETPLTFAFSTKKWNLAMSMIRNGASLFEELSGEQSLLPSAFEAMCAYGSIDDEECEGGNDNKFSSASSPPSFRFNDPDDVSPQINEDTFLHQNQHQNQNQIHNTSSGRLEGFFTDIHLDKMQSLSIRKSMDDDFLFAFFCSVKKNPININKKINGLTPLQLLCSPCRHSHPWGSKVILALIDAGADVNVTLTDHDITILDGWCQYDKGDTILHLICKDTDMTSRLLKPLLDRGVEINTTNDRGRTPLHTFMWECVDNYGRAEQILIAMIEAGANLRLCDNDGRTSLDLMHKTTFWRRADPAFFPVLLRINSSRFESRYNDKGVIMPPANIAAMLDEAIRKYAEPVLMQNLQYLYTLIAAATTSSSAEQATENFKSTLRRLFNSCRPLQSSLVEKDILKFLSKDNDPNCNSANAMELFFLNCGITAAEARRCSLILYEVGFHSERKLALALSRNAFHISELNLQEDEEILVDIGLSSAFKAIELWKERKRNQMSSSDNLSSGFNSGYSTSLSTLSTPTPTPNTFQGNSSNSIDRSPLARAGVSYFKQLETNHEIKRKSIKSSSSYAHFIEFDKSKVLASGKDKNRVTKIHSEKNLNFIGGGLLSTEDTVAWRVLIESMTQENLFLGLMAMAGDGDGDGDGYGVGGSISSLSDVLNDEFTFGFYGCYTSSPSHPRRSTLSIGATADKRNGLYCGGRKAIGTETWPGFNKGDCATFVFQPLLGRLSLIAHRRRSGHRDIWSLDGIDGANYNRPCVGLFHQYSSVSVTAVDSSKIESLVSILQANEDHLKSLGRQAVYTSPFAILASRDNDNDNDDESDVESGDSFGGERISPPASPLSQDRNRSHGRGRGRDRDRDRVNGIDVSISLFSDNDTSTISTTSSSAPSECVSPSLLLVDFSSQHRKHNSEIHLISPIHSTNHANQHGENGISNSNSYSNSLQQQSIPKSHRNHFTKTASNTSNTRNQSHNFGMLKTAGKISDILFPVDKVLPRANSFTSASVPSPPISPSSPSSPHPYPQHQHQHQHQSKRHGNSSNNSNNSGNSGNSNNSNNSGNSNHDNKLQRSPTPSPATSHPSHPSPLPLPLPPPPPPPPSPSTVSNSYDDMEERLKRFYVKNNPRRVDQVATILKDYCGKEGDLIRRLEKQYKTTFD